MGMFTSEQMKSFPPQFAPPNSKPRKYRNKPTVVDGIRFDSKAEAKRYGELKMLKQAGEVLWFARQVSFDLPGGIRYVADFVVCWRAENCLHYTTVEDVKGFRTKEYVMKKKLMKATWGIEVFEK